ncbi:hypothetical protein RJG79_08420 [Mycoplasmatota bacterium WC44]
MYSAHKEFLGYAGKYDEGDCSIRSKTLHEKWLNYLPCRVLRIEGDFDLDYKESRFLEFIKDIK